MADLLAGKTPGYWEHLADAAAASAFLVVAGAAILAAYTWPGGHLRAFCGGPKLCWLTGIRTTRTRFPMSLGNCRVLGQAPARITGSIISNWARNNETERPRVGYLGQPVMTWVLA